MLWRREMSAQWLPEGTSLIVVRRRNKYQAPVDNCRQQRGPDSHQACLMCRSWKQGHVETDCGAGLRLASVAQLADAFGLGPNFYGYVGSNPTGGTSGIIDDMTKTTEIEHHIGRAWSGPGLMELAEDCTCEKAPCGLVIMTKMGADCPRHDITRTIRQSHTKEQCPGAPQ